MTKNIEQIITLAPVTQEELPKFKEELQEAFMKGLKDSFLEAEDPTEMGPIPSEEDMQHSLTEKDAVIHHILLNGEKIGGVVLKINAETQHNEVDFFYTKASEHGQGIGAKAWQAIEAAYPDTKVWELYTPYFEKRNIHFYVNKCGFQIDEFWCEYYKPESVDMDNKEQNSDEGPDEMFRFIKVMK